MKHRIFCDLDGVIVNLGKRIHALTGKNPDIWDSTFWPFITNHKSFFIDLEPILGHDILLKKCMEFSSDGKIHILTAIPKPHRQIVDAPGQKLSWVRDHVDVPFQFNIGPFGEDKWKHCQYPTDILIDDSDRNIEDWISKGKGIGILHTDIKSTIEILERICNG
jgi:hypothetical protein